jgi:hypothetical protein
MTRFPKTARFLTLLILAVTPFTASASDSLPIEVALAYYKILGAEPNYAAMIYQNKNLIKNTKGFGQEALREQQKKALQEAFAKTTKDSVLFSSKKMFLDTVDVANRRLVLTGLEPDIPLIFPLSDTDKYGVFIRNVAEVVSMVPPYEFDDFVSLNYEQNHKHFLLPTEITLKPVAADVNDFMLNSGTAVHVLVADIVEIKIIDSSGKRLLLQKRFKNWSPEPPKTDSLYSPDLLPETSQ